jgi:hypothetical protein
MFFPRVRDQMHTYKEIGEFMTVLSYTSVFTILDRRWGDEGF